MATILAHLRIRSGEEARFEEIARELHAATHQRESGVRHYEYWRGSDPGSYYTLLSFDDFRSFIAHQTSEHHEAAAPAIGAVVESLRLEWVDPIAGASGLVPTEHQPAADGASDLTLAYTERFAAEVADWWRSLR